MLILVSAVGFGLGKIGFAHAADTAGVIADYTINPLLKVILRLMGWLISIAATIFAWIIDPKNMDIVINNSAVYNAWATVRDVLNVAFILVLLFSAFSTVFQVDKYSYKKILLTLVIMALLVNFSYPIARFIIDASNMLMYYFINSFNIGGGTWFTQIADKSALSGILSPSKADTTSLIASIIFSFLFAITLLVIAGLFVIRTVALAILVIFSSLAFTGSIVPFLSDQASKWWSNLFKYAFFGPVMVFMLYVSLKMMEYIEKAGMNSMKTIAGQQSVDPSIIASLSFFAIPIIILWAGIIFAQSMGLAGASAVIGAGTKAAKWAGKTFSGYNWGNQQFKDYKKERAARKEEARWKPGRNIGRRVNAIQDTLIPTEAAGRRRRNATEARNREDIKRRSEADTRDGNTLLHDLNTNINTALDPTTAAADKRTHAVTAQALRSMQDSELRQAVEHNAVALQTSVTAATDLFDGITAAQQTRLTGALTNINAGTGTNDDYNHILSHIRTGAGRVQREGIVNG